MAEEVSLKQQQQYQHHIPTTSLFSKDCSCPRRTTFTTSKANAQRLIWITNVKPPPVYPHSLFHKNVLGVCPTMEDFLQPTPTQPRKASSLEGKASSIPESSIEVVDTLKVEASTMKYPLRQKGQQRERQRQRSLNEAKWNGTTQGATNDENAYNPTVTFDSDGKYPVEFSCDDHLPFQTDGMFVSETEILYDVEASFAEGADLTSNVRAFEWIVLDRVVTYIGLDICKFAKQRRDQTNNSGARRALQEGEGTETQATLREQPSSQQRPQRPQALKAPTTIFSLSSMPLDEEGSEGACNFLQYNPTEESCLPIRGKVTARFVGIDSATTTEVEEYLQSTIKTVIETDPDILVNHITSVIYTSDREVVSPINTPGQESPSQSQGTGGGGLGTPLLSAVISASLLFLVLGFFFVRRSQREEEPETTSAPKQASLDVATAPGDLEEGRSSGSSESSSASPQASAADETAKIDPPNPMPAMTSSISASSSGEEAPYTDTPDSSEHLTNTIESTSDQEPSASAVVEAVSVVPLGSGVVTATGVNSGVYNLFTSTEKSAVPKAELPPRPPGLPPVPLQRTQSKKLKKRRKKKKKKKKTTLKRVNSRENISTMQAIPESEDEESEFGSEYGSEYDGSEYSTDDDSSGLQSGPSSGCNTPIRSLSRNGSRASSPRLSPQDELFPSDVFSDLDYTFDFEAPDLLAEMGTPDLLADTSHIMKLSDTTNMKRSPGRSSLSKKQSGKKRSNGTDKEDIPNVPTTGTRIRPLPPPWV